MIEKFSVAENNFEQNRCDKEGRKILLFVIMNIMETILVLKKRPVKPTFISSPSIWSIILVYAEPSVNFIKSWKTFSCHEIFNQLLNSK